MINLKMLENRNHSTPYIPYSFYECRMPDFYSNVPMHWHDEIEINRVLKGTGDFICGDHHYHASEGDFLIFPPNTLHSAIPVNGSQLYYQALVFHPVMLGMNMKDRCTMDYIRPILVNRVAIKNYYHPMNENYDNVKACMDIIFAQGNLPAPSNTVDKNHDIYHNHSIEADLILKGALLQLFGYLYRDISTIPAENTISYSEMIRPALEYMIKNYREAVTIHDLAECCHLSSSYFMNCFKKATGVGAMEYLSLHRINAACRLLLDTKENISDIAYNCGFSNLSNFNRQFKRRVGCSPNEYRRL